jgi:hypothetical protein
MSVTTVLWAMLAFELKHFLCDFALQSKFQVRTKKIYGHYGGLIHAGLHAVGSLPALLILGASPTLLVLIPVLEFALHYHIDWIKAWVDGKTGWTMQDDAYWALFGFDQFVHQLTYIGVIAWVAGVF